MVYRRAQTPFTHCCPWQIEQIQFQRRENLFQNQWSVAGARLAVRSWRHGQQDRLESLPSGARGEIVPMSRLTHLYTLCFTGRRVILMPPLIDGQWSSFTPHSVCRWQNPNNTVSETLVLLLYRDSQLSGRQMGSGDRLGRHVLGVSEF